MLVIKNLFANTGGIRDADSVPELGRSLKQEMATHSSILAWRIPWTEEFHGQVVYILYHQATETGGLQSMGLQRLGQD